MFLSVKAVAFCRLVISFNRGCLQVPGLSVAGDALGGVDLTGVDMAAYFSMIGFETQKVLSSAMRARE